MVSSGCIETARVYVCVSCVLWISYGYLRGKGKVCAQTANGVEDPGIEQVLSGYVPGMGRCVVLRGREWRWRWWHIQSSGESSTGSP